MKKLNTILIVLVAIIGGYLVFRNFPVKTIPIATNGTSTPEELIPSDWKIYNDKENKLTFSYPETLNTKYVQLVDWPPKIEISTSTYSCLNAGTETERTGKTEEIKISGNVYCVTKLVEGAAGSMYIQYAYQAKVGNKTLFYTFTLRQPQCANYNEPERTTCQTEEDQFDINPLINKVIQSTKLQ